MKLSDKIIHLRKQCGWSQEELAERLNVSRQSVSKWESGASVPELERISQMCSLFGVTADSLIRDEIAPDGSAALPGYPILTLEDVYAYLSQYQTVARNIGLGVAACVFSPAPLVMLTFFGEAIGSAVGIPLLLLLAAAGIWLFISAGTITNQYRHIEKHRFIPAPGVNAWAQDARERAKPGLVRESAVGVVLCVISPAPLVALGTLSPYLSGIGVGLLLAVVAAGTFLLVRSEVLKGCYRHLLKGKKA